MRTVFFQKTEEDVLLMAVFIAQLTREGLSFKIIDNGACGWAVELSGGF